MIKNFNKVNRAKISVYLFLLPLLIQLTKCASVNPPPGGPKDNKPPKLIRTMPRNGSLNYYGKKIVFEFNERIDGQKIKHKTLITPFLQGNYEIEVVKNTLTITFDKPLIPNDTYSISFIGGIKDLNEGNVLQNVRLVFSTGNKIDSAYINGKISLAYNKKPVADAIVGLYKISDTLNIEKQEPAYFTYTDDKGIFNLKNIKEGKYELYAITDENKNHKYDIKNEKIGFSQDTINLIDHNIDSLKIEVSRNDLYRTKPIGFKNETEYRINLNEGIYKYEIESTNKLYHILSENRKDIIFYKVELCEDTLPVKVNVIDSSYNDTTFIAKIVLSTPKKFKTYHDIIKKITPPAGEPIKDSIILTINTHEPIVYEKDTSIILNYDSISFRRIKLLKDFNANSANTEFTYKTKKLPQKFLELIITGKSLQSGIKDTNKKYLLRYEIPKVEQNKETEESNLEIIINTKEKDYIIQLLNEKMDPIYLGYNDKRILYKNIQPGKYSVRVIIDTNKDKKWDTGNYKLKIKPEKVILFENIVTVIKNWDIEDVNIEF